MDCVRSWKMRFCELFEKYSGWNGKKLIFWGAGATAKIWWADLMEAGIMPEYIVDSNRAGQAFRGFTIMDPGRLEYMENMDAYCIVVLTTNPYMYGRIRQQALKMGWNHVYTCSAVYFSVFQENIQAMAEGLADQKSKEMLYSFLASRMGGWLMDEGLIDHRQYFSLYCFSVINKEEVYVDAGAFAGDTLEKFLFEKFGTFQAYYAFEPLEENYRALLQRVSRLKLEWGG